MGAGASFSEGSSPEVKALIDQYGAMGEDVSPEDKLKAVKQSYTSGGAKLSDAETIFTVLHFNDVYNIEPRKKEPVGGVARFCTKLDELKASHPGDAPPLVLFSGDAFNPSIMSTVTRGEQMPPCLNHLGIAAACIGNHDFDHGVQRLEELKGQTNFPWLLSNCVDKATSEPLGGGKVTMMLEHAGLRIGLMGLIEFDWIATLSTIEAEDVVYTDFVVRARELCAQLRGEGADVVIALTHMRVPNDEKLAEQVGDIDLILGGHDHHYEVLEKQVKEEGRSLGRRAFVFKSGTDFRELTEITMVAKKGEGGRASVLHHHRHEVTSEVAERPELAELVQHYSGSLAKEMDQKVAETEVALECRFSEIRTRETNVGNFVTDVMRSVATPLPQGIDVALLNSGTLRADTVMAAGPLTMQDLVSLLPMMDELVVVGLTGAQLLATLENGVCMYPKLEGRFLQVSGVRFKFDPSRAPGARILQDSVMVLPPPTSTPEQQEQQPQPLDLGREYRVIVKEYMFRGKDGFDVLAEGKLLVDSSLPCLPTLVRNHFNLLSIMDAPEDSKEPKGKAEEDAAAAAALVTSAGADGAAAAEDEGSSKTRATTGSNLAGDKYLRRLSSQLMIKIEQEQQRDDAAGLKPHQLKNIAPVVEGRIVCVDA